ncbi:unnamed protein product, partial [Oppiella nova]
QLQHRVLHLERKLAHQSDEIVCLRSTLADVLRRVTQLEGRAPVVTSNTVPNNALNSKGSHLSPLRLNASSQSIYSQKYSRDYNLNYNHTPNGNGNGNALKGNLTNGSPGMNGNGLAANGHRRLSHYPSNNSLHSERGGLNSSSNSASPAPSPSPSQSSMSYRANTPTASPRHTPGREMRSPYSASTSNLVAMRKWSASQEFRGNSLEMANKFFGSWIF